MTLTRLHKFLTFLQKKKIFLIWLEWNLMCLVFPQHMSLLISLLRVFNLPSPCWRSKYWRRYCSRRIAHIGDLYFITWKNQDATQSPSLGSHENKWNRATGEMTNYSYTCRSRHLFWAGYCEYFLIHKFKHLLWILKRTVSSRRFFWVPTTYVLNEK